MSSFAAVILSCNEEECLPRCLESIADVAELFISVDAASTDQTEALAHQVTPHVFTHNLAQAAGGWAEVRNALQEEAEKRTAAEWFLWIDPDEWLAEGKAGLPQLFTQADAAGRTGLMVQMVDIPPGAEPGIRGATWQNCKFFRRGQRFARRRHEHLPVDQLRAVAPQVAIHHQKLQRQPVQDACMKIKTDLAALEADWQDWQDMRAAYYLGDAFFQTGDALTALLWYERGLTLPDTIAGAKSQLFAGLYAAHRTLGHYEEAKEAAHRRWACDYRDGRDCGWQLGSLAAENDQLDEAESWFKTVIAMPAAEAGLNQVLASSPVELSHYGLAVVAGKRGDLTGMHRHLREAEKFGPRPEYAILRGQLVKAVS